MEKILFHPGGKIVPHGGTIFSTGWNDLVLVDKDINPSKD